MNLPIQQPTMSSLQIAEIAGKKHYNVLASIRKMEEAWHKVTGLKFKFSEYTDPTGRVLPCYNLTKEECLYIATKFNDEARARLIMRWMELERRQMANPTNVADLFAATRQIADEMKQALADGKILPASDVTLTSYDIAIYCYLRNGIKSARDVPFITSRDMTSKALGIDIEDVEVAWERLERGGYIITRKFGDNLTFILGNRIP